MKCEIQTKNSPPAARVSQDILCSPVWELDTEHWYHLAWLNPQLKEQPLEEVILRIYQDPKQTDKILCDFHRIPNAKSYQHEWKNKKPYGDLTPSMILDESNLCAGELKILPEGCLQIITYDACPREEHNKGGSYMATIADIKIYPKYLTMGNKHIDKNGDIILQLEHANFMFKKSTIKPQSY